MAEDPAGSPETDVWEPTRTDALVVALGVVFVGAAALVTLVLPDAPGWTFLANLGLSAGVAIALIGVLLRFQLRIEAELRRLGKVIDEQAERTRRLEPHPIDPRPSGPQGPGTEQRAEAQAPSRGRPRVTSRRETADARRRWSSLIDDLASWWDSAHRPYRPRRPPREPLFRLPKWLYTVLDRVVVGVGWLAVSAIYTVAAVGCVIITFGVAAGIWDALLNAVGLRPGRASGEVGESGAVMVLAGFTAAALAGLATWSWADLRAPVAFAASMITLVGLAVAQYGFGVFA